MKIAISSDHAGVGLKTELSAFIMQLGYRVVDYGPMTAEVSVDYPDYASQVAKHIQKEAEDLGIVICGTGIGVSIVANKYEGIRCALCHDSYTAQITREHNNSNVLAIGARIIGVDMAKAITKNFIESTFMGERHQLRINKITEIEKMKGCCDNGNK